MKADWKAKPVEKKKKPAVKKEGGAAAEKKKKAVPKKGEQKGESLLGITTPKAANFPKWYKEILQRAELIEFYDISGCYILRPWAYRMWEIIQGFFDAEIKKLGVRNAYFPCLVSREALEREADHIAGFAPEVRARLSLSLSFIGLSVVDLIIIVALCELGVYVKLTPLLGCVGDPIRSVRDG